MRERLHNVGVRSVWVIVYSFFAVGVFYQLTTDIVLFFDLWEKYVSFAVVTGLLLPFLYQLKGEVSSLASSAAESRKTMHYQVQIRKKIEPMITNYVVTVLLISVLIFIFGVLVNYYKSRWGLFGHVVGSFLAALAVWVFFRVVHIYVLLRKVLAPVAARVSKEKQEEKKRKELLDRLREGTRKNPLVGDEHLSSCAHVHGH